MVVKINTLLASFPKKRPNLPDEYKEIFHKHYLDNRSSRGFVGKVAHKLESWMHNRACRDLKNICKPYSTLEVGAGTLNHLAYEEQGQVYDVVEPYRELYLDSPEKDRVRHFFDDISDVRGAYDRIISIAVFEHLIDLPGVISRCGVLLKAGGTLRVGIPAQGSPLWKMAYTFSTGAVFYMRYRLSYERLMQHEHVNNWQEIRLLLNYFFEDVKSSQMGLTPSLSLYHFYECSTPVLERCIKYSRG